MLKLRIKAYFLSLELEELNKPESERRKIPSVAELARACGVSRQQLSRLINEKNQTLDLEVTGKLMDVMNSRGFRMTELDIIEYQQSEFGQPVPS
jgi:transcriptional regulator with XRE-family HTH domain